MISPEPVERDYGNVWDGYDRQHEYEYAEHLEAKHERELDRLEVTPDPKLERRVKSGDVKQASDDFHRNVWRDLVLERDQGCSVHPNPADCAEGFQAHHVVAQQELRKRRPDLIWNPLVGMGVCGKAHRQHHSRVRPIAFAEIPYSVVVFVCEHGLRDYLDRRYP